MKLLITIDFPPENGGIQRFLESTVRSSFSEKDVVFVGCPPRLRTYNDCLPVKPVRKSWFAASLNKKLSLFVLLLPYVRVIRKSREAVHVECGNIYAAIVPWLVSFFVRQPYHIHVYGTEIVNLSKPRIKNLILRSILSRAQAVYVLTDYIRSLLEARGYVGAVIKRSPLLHFPRNDSPPPFKSRMYRLLSVGRLVEHKGHHILIQSAASLPADIPWSLHIVGGGPRKDFLLRQITEMRLHERVFLHSGLSDEQVAQQYRAAGVFVFPSLEISSGTEGFGLVQLDAMAYGLAVVASGVGGIPEVLAYGQCGTLIPPADDQALRQAIMGIWGHPRQAQNKIQAGYQQLKRYSV